MADQVQLYTTSLPSPYVFTLDVLKVYGASEPDRVTKFPGIVHEMLDGTIAEQIAGGRRDITIDFNVMSAANRRKVVKWWLDPDRKINCLATIADALTVSQYTGGGLANDDWYYQVTAIDTIGHSIANTTAQLDTSEGSKHTMQLAWTASANARLYGIYRKQGAGGTWYLIDYSVTNSYDDDGSITDALAVRQEDPPSAVSSISVIATNELEFSWAHETELARMLTLELREASIFTPTAGFPV